MKGLAWIFCGALMLGLGLGGAIQKTFFSTREWQHKMVECGCGAYDTKTGQFYTIDTAPAPEAAPILEPEPASTPEEADENYRRYLKEIEE